MIRPSSVVSALSVLSVLLPLAGCSTVPYTKRKSVVLVSEKEEKKLGEDAYRKTLKESKLVESGEQFEMIRRVGERLAAAAKRPDYKWEFNLIENDKLVNAWCMPGGKIAFYTGILPVTAGENGVATVMGHEIAHALARHGAERMSRGMMVQMGGQVLSVLTGTQSAAAQNAYGQLYGLGANLGVMLPHSRANESEADSIGLILMAEAGYDPRSAVEFWGRMSELGGKKKKDDPVGNFTSTHPSDKQRIKDLEKQIPNALTHYKPK